MKFLNLTKTFYVALSFGFTLVVFSSTAFACDCFGPSGKKAIRKESAAFLGTVTNLEYLDVKSASIEPRIVVTFSVSRVGVAT